jgi:peptidoglycan/xylan/chitin deacetylase (PgdA/CDA1 family)
VASLRTPGTENLNDKTPANDLRSRVRARLYRLRLGPGAPNVLGSEASFEPPIGHNWAPGEPPRGYYIDFRLKNESPQWPPYWIEERVKQFGVTNAQWGLGAFERYLDGEGEEWLAAARTCADHIVANLERGGPRDGAWLHLESMPHTFPLDAGWVSAMAQGEIASLLTRVHLETGEDGYAEAALRVLKTLRLPVAAGGTLAEVDGQPMLEEYPTATPSAVLNGAIFAIWGAYDLAAGLGDGEAKELFEATTSGLAALIDRYDVGYWSRYDLYPHRIPNLASPSYHLLHIRQLTALDRLSPRPQLAAAVERFERYRAHPGNRRRATAEKVAFRLAVPRNRTMARLLGQTTGGSEAAAADGPSRRGRGSDALVLCYHAVSESWPADLSIAPARLRQHLEHLQRRGYRGVTFGELVAGAEGKVVAVTFDDGYRSVIRLAQPILAELGFPGTLFVPTDHIGSEQPMAWPGIEQWLGTEHEPELIPMGWDEVRRLRDAGWEIGSHTRSHPKLTQIDADRLAEELGESRRICAAELGACATIAYPYGDHDEAVVAAAGAAGYAAAATLPDGSPPPRPLAWPRVGIYNNDDLRAFKLKVSPAVRRARGSAAWPLVAGGLRSAKRKVAG